jgi:hypothetical protein
MDLAGGAVVAVTVVVALVVVGGLGYLFDRSADPR